MNRKQLAEVVGREAGLSAEQAQAAVSVVLDAVVHAVAADDKVTLPAFGTFEMRRRGARAGRNPQTGETIQIPASAVPAFKPATAFKRAVAEG